MTLRYDPEPPRPAFEQSTASDPTRISVAVVDRVSGLAGGGIEIGRVGSGSWQALATRKEGNRLVARIDDSRYSPGQYALRTRVSDQAGNEASTDRRSDGRPMIVTLPLRVAASMRAGVVRRKFVRRRARGKHRRAIRRRVTVLAPTARVRFGRPVRLAGRLVNAEGDAIAGERVLVYSRTATSRRSSWASRPPTHQVAIATTPERVRRERSDSSTRGPVSSFPRNGTSLARTGRQLDRCEPPTAEERGRREVPRTARTSRDWQARRDSGPAVREIPDFPDGKDRLRRTVGHAISLQAVMRPCALPLQSPSSQGGHVSLRNREDPLGPCERSRTTLPVASARDFPWPRAFPY